MWEADMRRPSTGTLLAGAVVVALIGASVRHRGGGVTASRLEDAFAPTFANLVHLQRSILKLPEIDRAVLRATAQCRKAGTTGRDAGGAGDWTCTVLWSSPGQRIPLQDAYDLSVSSDGCYTATADGSEAHIGGPTLTARDGATITNLLYTFEGCFDTTGTGALP
jgi:ABC-2 type transport system permease protein